MLLLEAEMIGSRGRTDADTDETDILLPIRKRDGEFVFWLSFFYGFFVFTCCCFTAVASFDSTQINEGSHAFGFGNTSGRVHYCSISRGLAFRYAFDSNKDICRGSGCVWRGRRVPDSRRVVHS